MQRTSAPVERPLSPHLQVYRWQISNTLSIVHRLTGVVLAFGALALVSWLLAIASGPSAYLTITGLFGSLPGQVLLLGVTFAFFYHLCNGIRHLAWDAGLGFEKATAVRSGIAVIVASLALTLLFWVLAMTGAAG